MASANPEEEELNPTSFEFEDAPSGDDFFYALLQRANDALEITDFEVKVENSPQTHNNSLNGDLLSRVEFPESEQIVFDSESIAQSMSNDNFNLNSQTNEQQHSSNIPPRRRITRGLSKRLSSGQSSTESLENDPSNQKKVKKRTKTSERLRKYSVACASSPPLSADAENANFPNEQNDTDTFEKLLQEANDILEATGSINVEEHFGQYAFRNDQSTTNSKVKNLAIDGTKESDIDTSNILNVTPDIVWGFESVSNYIAQNSGIFGDNSRISDVDLREAGTSYDSQNGHVSDNEIHDLSSKLDNSIKEVLSRVDKITDLYFRPSEAQTTQTINVDDSITVSSPPSTSTVRSQVIPDASVITTPIVKTEPTISEPNEVGADDDIIFVGQIQPGQVVDIIDLCSTPPTPAISTSAQLKRRVEQMKVNAVIELNDSSDEKIPTKKSCESDIDDGKNGRCAICLEQSYSGKPTATKCGHIFCGPCITQAVRITKSCPICKQRIDVKQLFRLFF